MRWRARNYGGAAVAAAIALAVTGCGGGGAASGSQDGGSPSGTPGSPTSAPVKAIGTPGTVTVSWCDVKPGTAGAPNAQQLTLASYSVTDGQEVARTVSALPPGADTGILCDPNAHDSVPSALRQAFNKDFTMVAGLMPSPQQSSGGSDGAAVAFSLAPQGAPVGAPSADPFTVGAKDRVPAFQSGTSTLWYENRDRHVLSRDLDRQGAGTTDHGPSHGPVFALAGDQPWSRLPLGNTVDSVTVNPAGTAAAAGGGHGSGIWLKDAAAAGYGDEYVEPARFGPDASGSGSTGLPGGGTVPRCAPKSWTDDHALLCVGKGISRVVFSDTFDSVLKVEPLLPENDRDNTAVAPSPDLKSVVFLSRQGQDVAELYRLDLTPGSTPRKLASIAPNSPRVKSELRLVGWQ
ncbi:hypothetical protein ACIRD3_37595 [Kitasatospora sp. NPDC093550]|uniref:hypothetical protein n=1 Tax=Kitasatospora sp. NPDC093550 TaxID=3364089 RepID=UPI00382AE608